MNFAFPQVRDCGVRGSGHAAERPQNTRDVPKRYEEIQPGVTEGENFKPLVTS